MFFLFDAVVVVVPVVVVHSGSTLVHMLMGLLREATICSIHQRRNPSTY